jgi:hypothetical protein
VSTFDGSICVLFVLFCFDFESRSSYAAQAGLKLLGSSAPLTSSSRVAENIGVHPGTQLEDSICKFLLIPSQDQVP